MANFRGKGTPTWQKIGYWLFILGLALLALYALAQAYQQRTLEHRHQVEARLRIVGENQTRNIVNWRRNRMANASALTQDRLFAKALATWQAQGRPDVSRHLLENQIQTLVEYNEFAVVHVLDTHGQLLLSTDSAPLRALRAPEMQAMQEALTTAEPVPVEPQTGGFFAFPFFGIMTPLFNDLDPVGVAWLVVDLRSTLFPIVQGWQLDSASAEAVLIQRVENGIININPLPKRDMPALSNALPMTRSFSPGVQAVLGARGLIQGTNYMGEPVLSMVSAIDGAPWWLVLQIDEAEALANQQRREGLTLGLSVGAVLLSVGLLVTAWQWKAWRRERLLKHDLQLQNHWLASAQNAASLGYFVYDFQKENFYISDATASIFGLSEEGWFPMKRWAALVFPEDKRCVLDAHEQAIHHDQALQATYRIVRESDRQVRWVQVWAEMEVASSDAQRLGLHTKRMVGIVQDITQRKQVEDELADHRKRLESQVRLDPLTGIANRLALEETLDKEWCRAVRHSQSLALLMLDLDHFKSYNDTYGHVQGDACLRQVAQALATTVGRAGELVARYGGEEFVVLLPSHTQEQAAAVAQRIVMAIRDLRLPHACGVPPQKFVTISVGVAVTQPCFDAAQKDSITQLFEQADSALYAAKQAGRNCCKTYSGNTQTSPE